MLPGLLKEIAHAGCTYPHNHLNEFGSAHGKERYTRFSRDRTGQQGLTRTRGTHQQYTFGCCAPKTCVLFWVLEKIDNLNKLIFCLVNSRHVVKSYLCRCLLVEPPGAAAAHPHHTSHTQASRALARGSENPHVKQYDQQRRT